MTSSSTRPYQQHGVFFPIQTTDEDADPPLTSVEWPPLPAHLGQPSPRKKRRTAAEAAGLHMAQKGFLLVKILVDMDPGQVLLVQSEANGKLYILKISKPGSDIEEHEDATFYEEPLDLRVSTWEDAPGYLNVDAPFFNKLSYWQKLASEETDPTYSLYFEFCNGGTAEQLMDKYYNRENTPVPEHFIWLVAEQLSLAIAWLRYGIRPDTPDQTSPDDLSEDWSVIHHRDLNARNIFINYLPNARGRPRTSAAGAETNAFPQIVLGDFGNAGIEGDDTTALPPNATDWGKLEPELRPWEDVYTLGRLLRSLCMTHVPFDGDGNDHWSSRPDNRTLAAANAHGGAPPYSGELIALLQKFEWEGMTDGEIDDVADPNTDFQANGRWIVGTLLPAARAQVAKYRADRQDAMSVAWTKPPTPGVFAYNPRYATEAGDEATGMARVRPGATAGEMGSVERNERAAHRQLLRLKQRWGVVMPYEVRVVEFEAPTVAEAEFPDAP
ncbi:unnamed protein product [Discula destructiva]